MDESNANLSSEDRADAVIASPAFSHNTLQKYTQRMVSAQGSLCDDSITN